ncbi:Amine oxidase [flavin-containing] B [Fusarium oxysporum f. sp. albedinis]|nr:Amine oxidase [flavin-containing] B [Fusarium oxysporum f. sp. albedinis]
MLRPATTRLHFKLRPLAPAQHFTSAVMHWLMVDSVPYELETVPVEEEYRKRGILVSVDVNGTKDENIEALTKALQQCKSWQKTIET